MSILEQKRNEYATSLATLKQKKFAEINAKVEAYKTQLISEMSHADEQKLEEIISAIDKIIEFEKTQA